MSSIGTSSQGCQVSGRGVEPVLSVFHCVDDFSAIPYWWHNSGNQMGLEGECCREADVVICTGRKLVESRRRFNGNIHFVPEGADVEAFLAAASSDVPVPDSMAALPGKVVGYVGVIDFRLDVDLIAYMAERHPDWSFALVGPMKGDTQDMTRLRSLPNVHFLGRQPLEAVPAFVKGMDVCLHPVRPERLHTPHLPAQTLRVHGGGEAERRDRDGGDDPVRGCGDGHRPFT